MKKIEGKNCNPGKFGRFGLLRVLLPGVDFSFDACLFRISCSQVCDLSSVNEIKSFMSRFTSKDVPIHVLVKFVFPLQVFHTIVILKEESCSLLAFCEQYLWNFSLFVLLQFSRGNFDGVEQYARNKRIQVRKDRMLFNFIGFH
ncbi:hypothetical protein RHSIM_Rhsim06G0091900 [Rhododendron simsii]|uniref:Uncharacterized protein n=1 Tax=Rhododendron simsii TaxID=118357 RepID=A0A834GVU9_RHOSS|nr:hypothetical protein RHSIM_Rhsim06G0091900 [Rhododendron simsii]